jgi:hypothetical protein
VSASVYLLIGAGIAAYFAVHDLIEDGDWPKAVGIVLICALWPISIGLGIGLMAGSIFRTVKGAITRAFRKSRGDA